MENHLRRYFEARFVSGIITRIAVFKGVGRSCVSLLEEFYA